MKHITTFHACMISLVSDRSIHFILLCVKIKIERFIVFTLEL